MSGIGKAPSLSECLAGIRRCEQRLRALGLLHADLFGSVARGEAEADSDVDVLATLDYERGVSTATLLRAEQILADELGRRVDVISRGGLRSPRHDSVLDEAVRVF